jgi:hypothetical protein
MARPSKTATEFPHLAALLGSLAAILILPRVTFGNTAAVMPQRKEFVHISVPQKP